MKVSDITINEVAHYLKFEDEDLTPNIVYELENNLIVAKKYIKSHTGLTDEQIDAHEDFYIVVMVLCEDMYDNRKLYIEKGNLNKVVESILGMHSVNLL